MEPQRQAIRFVTVLAAFFAVAALQADRATAQFVVTEIIDSTGRRHT